MFREEQSAGVSGTVRRADRAELAVMRVSGDERQEGFLEGEGKGGASPAYDSSKMFLHLWLSWRSEGRD